MNNSIHYISILAKMNLLQKTIEKVYPLTGSVRELSLSVKKNNDVFQCPEECLQLEEIQILSKEIYLEAKRNVELLQNHIKALDGLCKKPKSKK